MTLDSSTSVITSSPHSAPSSSTGKDYHLIFRQNFLYDAAKHGKVDQFERMLFRYWQSPEFSAEEEAAYSAAIHLRQKTKLKALMLAIKGGQLEVVKTMVEKEKFDVNVLDEHGNVPLIYAVQHEHFEVMKYLVEKGNAAVDLPNRHGETPLLVAVAKNLTEYAKFLLEETKVYVNHQDENAFTALIWASLHGNLCVVEHLVELSGANANLVTDEGQTALFVAIREGHVPVVKYLLEKGNVDLSAVTKEGFTPLMLAIKFRMKSISRYLVEEKKMDVNAARVDGKTAIILSAIEGQRDLIQYLITLPQVNVDAQDSNGCTALMYASARGFLEMMKDLIKQGSANPYTKRMDGRRAIHFAKTDYIEQYLQVGYWYFQPYHPIIPLPITAAYACLHFLLHFLEVKTRKAKEDHNDADISKYADYSKRLRQCFRVKINNAPAYYQMQEDDYFSFLQDSLLIGCGAPLDIARTPSTALGATSKTASAANATTNTPTPPASPYAKFTSSSSPQRLSTTATSTFSFTALEKFELQVMPFKEQYEHLLTILKAFYKDKVAKDALYKKNADLIQGTSSLLDMLRFKKINSLIEIILSSISEDHFEEDDTPAPASANVPPAPPSTEANKPMLQKESENHEESNQQIQNPSSGDEQPPPTPPNPPTPPPQNTEAPEQHDVSHDDYGEEQFEDHDHES